MTCDELKTFAKEVAEPKMAELLANAKTPDFLRCVAKMQIEVLDCRSCGKDYRIIVNGFTCRDGKVFAETLCDLAFDEEEAKEQMEWLGECAFLKEGTVTVWDALEEVTLEVKFYNAGKYLSLFPALTWLATTPMWVQSQYLPILEAAAKADSEASTEEKETNHGTGHSLIVNVEGGYLRADPSQDPDYPGIDVEFIADNEPDDIYSRPRVLFEKPIDGSLRALIWNNPSSEDYEEEIIFPVENGKA